MVQDIIHVNTDVLFSSGFHQRLESILSSIQRIQLGIVVHVVSVVTVRGMGRTQPQRRHAHPIQVIQPVLDAFEISHSVFVGIGEGVNKDLIGRGRPFIPIKRVRVRHEIHDVLPCLGDGNSHRFRTFDGDRPGTVISRVNLGRHRQGGIACACGLIQDNPSVGRCRSPSAVGGDGKELKRRVLRLEGNGFGSHGESILLNWIDRIYFRITRQGDAEHGNRQHKQEGSLFLHDKTV